ncbi:MAG TPA: hypothetical protein VIC84_00580 [Blastocatellia bacterium]
MRRNDALIFFGSWSSPSDAQEAPDTRSLGPSSARPFPEDGSVPDGAGLLSFPGFFVAGLVENSMSNGVDEDDAAAWLLKSAPH